MKLLIAALVAGVLAPFVFVGFVIMAVAGGGGALANGNCITDANLAPIMATIRTLESGGDYLAYNDGNGRGNPATGAYQFLDSSWDNYGGFAQARHAPPETQDAKAAEWISAILERFDSDVTAVPVSWYIGETGYQRLHDDPSSPGWDTIPVPEAGNSLTPREYQAKWMTTYGEQAVEIPTVSCGYTPGQFGDLPDSLDCSSIRWGGYANGRIPANAMRYTSHSGSLHTAASAAFDDLYAAAQAAGLDLRGWGYRPTAAGGHTSGSSCHGLGLAVDITVLVPGNGHRFVTREAAFASAEFTWLCANAEQFGWITPRWAIPEGRICGTVVGTGTGGWVGDECCFLEPWHIEAAGIVVTHPDFVGATDSQFAVAS